MRVYAHYTKATDTQYDRNALLATLRSVLPANTVLCGQEKLRHYECDGLSAYRQAPSAMALPADVHQVCAVMRVCHAQKVPVVARGAGTGRPGALPLADGSIDGSWQIEVVLSLDPIDLTACVQSGVRNHARLPGSGPY